MAGRDGGFGWQVGVAELERSSAFSDFPGCDRIFTPIAGDPAPELAVNGGAFAACPLLKPKPFPGDVPTESRVLAPGRAFNVVWERARFEADVQVLTLAAGDPLPIEPASNIVLYCHAGEVASAEGRLAAGDSLVGPGPATPATAVSDAVVIAVAIRGRQTAV